MKTQERRDAEAVTIFAELLVYLLTTGAGAVVLVRVSQFVALNDDVLDFLVNAVLGCAVVASIRYVYRHRGCSEHPDLVLPPSARRWPCV